MPESEKAAKQIAAHSKTPDGKPTTSQFPPDRPGQKAIHNVIGNFSFDVSDFDDVGVTHWAITVPKPTLREICDAAIAEYERRFIADIPARYSDRVELVEQIAAIIDCEYDVSKRGEISNIDHIARAIVKGLNLSPQPADDNQTGLSDTGDGLAETETTPGLSQEDLRKAEVPQARYWTAWNATPDAVAPVGGPVWLLFQDGEYYTDTPSAYAWDDFAQCPKYEIIAYCPGDKPPEKDADGYWPHSGGGLRPVAENAMVEVRGFHGIDGVICHANELHIWDSATRFKLAGGEG